MECHWWGCFMLLKCVGLEDHRWWLQTLLAFSPRSLGKRFPILPNFFCHGWPKPTKHQNYLLKHHNHFLKVVYSQMCSNRFNWGDIFGCVFFSCLPPNLPFLAWNFWIAPGVPVSLEDLWPAKLGDAVTDAAVEEAAPRGDVGREWFNTGFKTSCHMQSLVAQIAPQKKGTWETILPTINFAMLSSCEGQAF